MYKVGDRIVYPMHGAGVIEAIEAKEILGEKRQYYIVKMPVGDLELMIPADSATEKGIRVVVNEEVADEVIRELASYNEDETANWNKRYRENMVKIKNGNIFEVAHVVKNLLCRESAKGLSTGERKMLLNARQILISELILAKGVMKDEIEHFLDDLALAN